MTKISSLEANNLARRRMIMFGAAAIGATAAGFTIPDGLAQRTQESMPLQGRMRMLEYMPAGDGFRLPQLPFVDASGQRLTIADFVGRPTILTMWRINCHVCQVDMPELSRVYESAGGQGMTFVPLSFPQDSLVDVEGFHRRKNINNLPIYRMESMELFNTYAPLHPQAGARATPTTILFDRRGNARLAIVGVRTGLHLDEGQALLEWLKTA